MRLPALWGATDAEAAVRTPADDLVAVPRARWVRAVSSSAPAATLWRWVCQLTVAPYSYDLVDNLGRRSPRTPTPGAERVAPGQRLLMIFVVDAVVPGEHLTIRRRRPGGRLVGEFAVTYAVHAQPGGSRLVATVVVGGGDGRAARLVRTALAWGDLVMMRKQLITLALRSRACVPVLEHGNARTRP